MVIPRDGTVYFDEASFSPLTEDDGSVRHFIAVQRDVRPGSGRRRRRTPRAARSWTSADSSAAVLRLVADATHEAIGEQFGTVAVARYHPHDHCVTICLAGHPQLVLVPRDGGPRLVGTPGTLLGPFGTVELVDTEVEFAVGDCLLLYADGVTEAQSPRRELSESRNCCRPCRSWNRQIPTG